MVPIEERYTKWFSVSPEKKRLHSTPDIEPYTYCVPRGLEMKIPWNIHFSFAKQFT